MDVVLETDFGDASKHGRTLDQAVVSVSHTGQQSEQGSSSHKFGKDMRRAICPRSCKTNLNLDVILEQQAWLGRKRQAARRQGEPVMADGAHRNGPNQGTIAKDRP